MVNCPQDRQFELINRSLLEIPFNDFEIYHNIDDDKERDPKKGGNCIYLGHRFLERFREISDVEPIIIGAREMMHFAFVLNTEDNELFFDPFMRTEQTVKVPRENGDITAIEAHPQDEILKCSWQLKKGQKRGIRKIIASKIFDLKGRDKPSVKKLHSYLYPFKSTELPHESDVLRERKSVLAISHLEKIGDLIREFRFIYRFQYACSQVTSYNSGGEPGEPHRNESVYLKNLEPILAQLSMTYAEFMEYIEHAVKVREELRDIVI